MQQSQLLNTQTAELPAVRATNKLARVIGESRVFQNYEKALQQLRGDSAAQRLFSDFQQAEQSYQMKQSWGGTNPDDEGQLRKKQKQVLSNPSLKAYFQAQDELAQTLKEVNVFISEKLGIDFANSTKPASSCC